MRVRWLPGFALISLAPVALLLTRAVGGAAAYEKRASVAQHRVETAPAPANVRRDDPFLGVIVADESADVAPPIAGKVVEVYVSIGDRVHKGQVLATLDSSLTQADLATAQAAERAQQVEQELARALRDAAEERERHLRALSEHGLTPGADLASAERESEQARLRVIASQTIGAQKAAQVRRLSAERQLLEVRAPFDGAVVARFVDPGAAVSLSPVRPIVRLISGERLRLRMAIPETLSSRVELGTRVRAVTEAGNVRVLGHIQRLSPQIDPASHTLTAEATLDESPSGVFAGAVVAVTLHH